jgi:hypothetical protein
MEEEIDIDLPPEPQGESLEKTTTDQPDEE